MSSTAGRLAAGRRCSPAAAASSVSNRRHGDLVAARRKFPFPYLWDETQDVAKAYGALCTPDFFGYNGKLELQYRGRLDDAGRSAKPDAPRELFNAMVEVARTGRGPAVQTPSMGCSIKWKSAG